MLFSVIIPTFNRAHLIGDTLRSVLAQSFKDFEIIVVDDGSTDNTQEVLAQFGDKVRVLALPNGGPAAARNEGVRVAQGVYAAFLDSDDLWFPWTLETYRKALTAHNSPAILRAAVREFTGPLADMEPEDSQWKFYDDYFSAARDLAFLGGGMTVIQRQWFIEIGGFDTSFHVAEDHDFGLRAGVLPGFITILRPATLAYRRQEGSASDNLERTVQASFHLLAKEMEGRYPGGGQRRSDRWRFLTGEVRPLVIALIRQRKLSPALELYRRTARMHLALGRLRFLCIVPLMCCLSWMPGFGSRSRWRH